jgi:methionyl aminopeptidase
VPRVTCSPDAGARSNFLGYHGFPGVICASPNDVVVHGIPATDVVLEAGDIISIDCGAIIDGWHADAPSPSASTRSTTPSQRAHRRGSRSLDAAIVALTEGKNLADVGGAVEATANAAGLRRRARLRRPRDRHRDARAARQSRTTAPRGVGGPGSRRAWCSRSSRSSPRAMPRPRCSTDDWTVVTVDGSRAAHVEHTIALTDDGRRSSPFRDR